VFVLLPDPPGEPAGAIAVSNAAGTQELRQSGQAVRVESPDRTPGVAFEMDRAEVQRVFGEALAAQPPEPVRLVVYFRLGSDELTPQARAAIPDMVRAIRDRASRDVSVLGHSDTLAGPQRNYRLGLLRARRVAAALASMGVDRAILDVRSHGESDLAVPTADGVPESRNRRVEVTIR
jgi:outer membrane protein OmpA-like peptidoglycan-associated protein